MTGFAEDGRRVDHAAEARRALDGAEGHYWDESPAQVALYLQKAQAEATLALVDQQRIANLIALGTSHEVEPRDAVSALMDARKGLGL